MHRSDDVLRLVECVINEVLRSLEALAVDLHVIHRKIGLAAEFRDSMSIDGNAAGDNQFFRLSAAGDTGVSEQFLEAFFRHGVPSAQDYLLIPQLWRFQNRAGHFLPL